jgi:hypothetical protein
VHAALSQALPARRSRSGDEADPLMREAARALVSAVPHAPDHALILWIVDTISHAVIHNGVVERRDDLVSGRLGEELIHLLIAYLRAPRS